MTRIADNVFLLSTLLLAACGWVISFVGACVFRSGISGGAWWIVIYQLLLLMSIAFALTTNTYGHYRLVILTFLAASLSMLTYQLDYALPTSKFKSQYKGGAGVYAAGYIILIIIQFLWVIVFGSESDSYFGQFGPGYTGNTVGVSNAASSSSELVRPMNEMTADKTMVEATTPYTAPTAYTQNTAYHATSPPTHPVATATIEPNHNIARVDNQIQYREKVQALHAYSANPDDPNELSFAKGETLDIVDRNGNWWQARKLDGSIGIIPSNYFAASA
ncbi:uncharacterized protein EV154DRAFT_491667 [Mucor mucedo]|uniref:uncharacterized protein n=1 Tax=Mucor mucedo TaxID=29922 RepID=UPI0022207C8F|nr:uncharacterized protein EV154DRAFT_491667 [Mucor mucedo]KAI7896629.1 hypothetical protein EV154DRAFT_491667 [Mucor mucedo]